MTSTNFISNATNLAEIINHKKQITNNAHHLNILMINPYGLLWNRNNAD